MSDWSNEIYVFFTPLALFFFINLLIVLNHLNWNEVLGREKLVEVEHQLVFISRKTNP